MNKWSNCNKLDQFIQLLAIEEVLSANKIIEEITTVKDFFTSQSKLNEFIDFAKKRHQLYKTAFSNNKGWGDVQTPQWFVKIIYKILKQSNFSPDVILEPTFGDGSFLLASLAYSSNIKFLYGVEIQEKHIWRFLLQLIERMIIERKKLPTQIKIAQDNIFTHNFARELIDNQELKILIIGNPPWVTSSELSVLESNNVPIKSNRKGLSGLDALTGKSNFDITESIITKLISTFSNHRCKIALLCKETVIRNILKDIKKEKYPVDNIRAIKFNSEEIFNKQCDAALFLADINKDSNCTFCLVSDLQNPFVTTSKFGWVNDKFVSDIDNYELNKTIEGKSLVIWRQGIKHDCVKVLELEQKANGLLENKLEEMIILEEPLLYPLLKGSDLRDFTIKDTNRRLLLTQKALNEEIKNIDKLYPNTWKYLNDHLSYFQKRKSKVYQSKTDFSIFGVGDYSFRNYKVAIAGFYKEAKFTLIPPLNNKPAVLDDTCYYIGFDSYLDALIYCTALNNRETKEFLKSITFENSKRPFTKEILMRIDTKKILSNLTSEKIKEIWFENNFSNDSNYALKEMLIRKNEIIKG
ncbi:MAG: hypothetical protein FK734_21620 [Asgard group archaeon]|nr:hypothetical protein [Asgard group archaeon]